jgi:hypothetical protein
MAMDRWFAQNPERYWCLVCIVLALTMFALLRPMLQPGWRDVKGTDWRWALVILCVLAVGRWPTWFMTEINADESQLIAGAITLRHDPVFWRSVDGATAGPIDFYALLPAGWIHGADDYFSARITALLLIAAALTFAHQAVALVFGRQLARITGFSAACFESLTLNVDLLHYSTELVPLCLLAGAIFLCVRQLAAREPWWWNAVGGLLLGAAPFAKLQVAPLAALVGLVWIVGEWQQREKNADARTGLIALCLAAVVPMLGVAAALTVTGLWRDAVVPYVLNNVSYVTDTPWSLKGLFAIFFLEKYSESSLLVYWLGGAGICLLLSLPLGREAARPGRLFAAAAIALSVASLACILLPCRPFVHYWQLLVVPVTLLLGSTIGLVANAPETASSVYRSAIMSGALLCTSVGLLYGRGRVPHAYVDYRARAPMFAMFAPEPGDPVADLVKRYTRTGEALAIWGIKPRCYVETALRQATRSAHSQWEIYEGPYNAYYIERYLRDLRSSAPPVFLDAVGPGNLGFPNRLAAHDILFPDLADYIRRRYTQVADLAGCRVYVRNDRLPAAH